MASRSMLTYGPDFPGLDELRLPDSTPGAETARNCRFDRGALEGLETCPLLLALPGTIQGITGFVGPELVAGAGAAPVFVYGQEGYTDHGLRPPSGSVTAKNFQAYRFQGVACDADGVYICDYYAARVLFFPYGQKTATQVYGQPDFTNGTGGCSASALGAPTSAAVDGLGGLYVGDGGNARILYFPAPGAATKVYGQPDFTTNTTPYPTASTVFSPSGVAVGPDGLYVADIAWNRVLFFPFGEDGIAQATATRVYGQADFGSTSANRGGGVAANTLKGPCHLAVDAAGGLLVCDAGNNRVLRYPAGETTPDRVYGQAGSYTDATARTAAEAGGLALSGPVGVAAGDGGVYIADTENRRALYFPGASTTATQVYGQETLYASATPGAAGTGANTLDYPMGLVWSSEGGLVVTDRTAYRALRYKKS